MEERSLTLNILAARRFRRTKKISYLPTSVASCEVGAKLEELKAKDLLSTEAIKARFFGDYESRLSGRDMIAL